MMNWIEISKGGVELGWEEILNILPHRYPFLLVDRVLEIRTAAELRAGMPEKELHAARKGSFTRTCKNITFNEPQFQGHFPTNPVFPGVLTMEVMAQSAIFATAPFVAAENGGVLPLLQVALAGFDEVRFRKPIRPGDQLITQVTVLSTKSSVWSFDAFVEVAGKRVAEGKFLAHLTTRS